MQARMGPVSNGRSLCVHCMSARAGAACRSGVGHAGVACRQQGGARWWRLVQTAVLDGHGSKRRHATVHAVEVLATYCNTEQCVGVAGHSPRPNMRAQPVRRTHPVLAPPLIPAPPVALLVPLHQGLVKAKVLCALCLVLHTPFTLPHTCSSPPPPLCPSAPRGWPGQGQCAQYLWLCDHPAHSAGQGGHLPSEQEVGAWGRPAGGLELD